MLVNNFVVILAGGFGKRLFPLSTNDLPKQFIKLFNNFSTFQLISQQMHECNFQIIIFGNKNHKSIIELQLKEINITNYYLILENESKNTFLPSLISCYLPFIQDCDNIILSPSDYIINDENQFQNMIFEATKSEKLLGNIALFGLEVKNFDSNFGYMQVLENNKIEKFIEKPKQLESFENYYKNSGIYVYNVALYKQICQKFQEDIYNKINIESFIFDNNKILKLNYDSLNIINSLSIDCAISEKCQNMNMIKLPFDIIDIGNFSSLFDILSENCNDSIEQRPWGNFKVLFENNYCKIKEIIVNPGHRTSFHSHNFRSESTFAISGSGIAVIDDKNIQINSNQLINFSIKSKHRLWNNSNEILRLLEIQIGNNLFDEDIIRHSDDYGRADKKNNMPMQLQLHHFRPEFQVVPLVKAS